MTRRQLKRVVVGAVAYLVVVGVGVALAHFHEEWGWKDLSKSLVPLAIAVPGAIFAYLFPLRLQFLREFASAREQALTLVRDLSEREPLPNRLDSSFCAGAWTRAGSVLARLREHDAPVEAIAAISNVYAHLTSILATIESIRKSQFGTRAEADATECENRRREDSELYAERDAAQDKLWRSTLEALEPVSAARSP